MPYDDRLRTQDEDDDEAPETPTDEPAPAPVQDPPAEPDPAPYVVERRGASGDSPHASEVNAPEQVRSAGGGRERRGFASMSPEKQREIASKGGRAAHQKGTAHEWTSDEARSAGRKGGQISRGGRGRVAGGASVDAPQGAGSIPQNGSNGVGE
jgi:hypothetical protein